MVSGQWSVVGGRWSLVIGHWSLVIGSNDNEQLTTNN